MGGEVMAIDRTMEASIQKAFRMVDPSLPGYQGKRFENLDEVLANPTDQRAYAVFEALDKGYSVERVYELSKIDPWWLFKCKNIVDLTQKLRTMTEADLTSEFMGELKLRGFGDRQIAINLNDENATEDSYTGAPTRSFDIKRSETIEYD
eukprot:TRINITY_DN4341_c0_g1_i1.p1 TRINITY_DN4341_c0_g1~~TRINITY_DN4341_c0_g1_i1.p1  ORF type:complete len:150 (+),score=35.49 TRINITY_DN4341_c0_g1_i1:44-493(+)